MSSPAMNLLDAYREMLTIRRFEESALELSRAAEVSGSIHLCLGQEAIPVGTMQALMPQDRVVATYRTLQRRVAELAGGMVGTLGLQSGDRVALIMRNGPSYVEVFHAAWHGGLTAVPIRKSAAM